MSRCRTESSGDSGFAHREPAQRFGYVTMPLDLAQVIDAGVRSAGKPVFNPWNFAQLVKIAILLNSREQAAPWQPSNSA